MNAFLQFGSLAVYKGSVITALGLVLSLVMTLTLFRQRQDRTAPVLAFYILSTVLGGFLARFLHWYFNPEMYDSFLQAFTDYSVGSWMMPGLLAGILLSAWILGRTGLTSGQSLLDCAAPGILFFIASVRISALWNDSCRGVMEVTRPFFQRLPFAVAETDAAGNTTWVLATFFLSFLILILLTVLSYAQNRRIFIRNLKTEPGDVFRWSLLGYCALEIVADSTRSDSPLMHFRFLTDLNQYSAFISAAQIFSGVFALAVLVGYSARSIRSSGCTWKHVLIWALFAASLGGIGYLGEYQVQRYASYGRSYTVMVVSVMAMLLSLRLMAVLRSRALNGMQKNGGTDPEA